MDTDSIINNVFLGRSSDEIEITALPAPWVCPKCNKANAPWVNQCPCPANKREPTKYDPFPFPYPRPWIPPEPAQTDDPMPWKAPYTGDPLPGEAPYTGDLLPPFDPASGDDSPFDSGSGSDYEQTASVTSPKIAYRTDAGSLVR